MDELIAFLRARLDEDKLVAEDADRAGLGDSWPFWIDMDIESDYIWANKFREHFTPTRMLADVAAKRAIIAALERADQAAGNLISPEAAYAMEYAVRLLAQPFADHPDFKPEWRAA